MSRSEEDEEDEFDEFGNNVDNWLDHAASLLGCSKILIRHSVLFGARVRPPFPIPESHVVRGALLFRAFALECALKALWLKQGSPLAKKGRFVPIPGVGQHDLAALAQKTSFSLSKGEKELLERLTLWSERGRYPIERSVDKHSFPVPLWTSGDEKLIPGLFRRIGAALGPPQQGRGRKRATRRK